MRLRIGDWLVHEEANLISKGQTRVQLERRAMAVLVHLAKHAGQVVSKDDLIAAVWNGNAVSDHSAAIVISDLRRALGDDRNFIETIPKRGYRLVAPVVHITAEPEALVSRVATRLSVHRRVVALAVVVLGIAALVGAAFIGGWFNASTPPRLVVTAIGNDTGSTDNDAVAGALSEFLAVELRRLMPGEVVRWREPAALTRDSMVRLRQNVGDAPGRVCAARVVLDGDKPYLIVELTDLSGVEIGWSRAYPLKPAEFSLLAGQVAGDLAIELGLSTVRETPVASGNVEQLYWQARALWGLRNEESVRAARDILLRVLEEAPDFAPAHAALADIYAHKTREDLGLGDIDPFAEADTHLARAKALAPDSSEIAVTEAVLAFYRDRNAAAAREALNRALLLDPENALAWQTHAMVASAIGEDAVALDSIARAAALDPLSAGVAWDRVWFFYIAGRFGRAAAAAEAASSIAPAGHFFVALIDDARGAREAAFEEWVRRAETRGLSGTTAALVRGEAVSGPLADAYRELLARMSTENGYVETPVPLAVLRLNAGDREGAIAALESIVSPLDTWMANWLMRIPALAPLRDEPRVQAVAARLALRE